MKSTPLLSHRRLDVSMTAWRIVWSYVNDGSFVTYLNVTCQCIIAGV